MGKYFNNSKSNIFWRRQDEFVYMIAQSNGLSHPLKVEHAFIITFYNFFKYLSCLKGNL